MSITAHAAFNLADASFSLGAVGLNLILKLQGLSISLILHYFHLANYQYYSETVGGDMGLYEHTLNKHTVNAVILKSRIIRSLG